MNRFIFSFFLLFLVFAHSKECSVSICESETGKSCDQKGNSVFFIEITEERDEQRSIDDYVKSKGGTGYSIVESESAKTRPEHVVIQVYTQGGVTTPTWVFIKFYRVEKEVQFCSIDNKPSVPEKCDFGFCSGADKKRYYDATWFETGTGCTSQTVKRYSTSNSYRYVVRFSCEQPKKSTDICYFMADPPIDCNNDDSEEEAGEDDKPPPTVDPEVPCFGNVPDCNNGTPPTWIDPETNIPCWGEKCGTTPPPDYIDPETNLPCWGNNCGVSPPSSGGSNGGDGPGGEKPGNGNGNGEGEGDGNGWGDCPKGGCIDFGGWGKGDGLPSLPDTLWDPKHKESELEKALKKHIEENRKDGFFLVDTDIGIGSCPVEYNFPLAGSTFVLSIPCHIFEKLRGVFLLLSTWMGYSIIFRKRR